jgi:hypothetical protein
MVRRTAAAQVSHLASHGAFPALRDAAAEDLALVAPHRTFVLPLEAVAAKGLAEAQPSGWRFLVAVKDRIVASAELCDDSGSAPIINAGPYVGSTAAAIDQLAALPALARDDFELRLLTVPALYVVAAWLAGRSHILTPLSPAPSFLEADRHYSDQELMASLRGPAERILSSEDSTSGG